MGSTASREYQHRDLSKSDVLMDVLKLEFKLMQNFPCPLALHPFAI